MEAYLDGTLTAEKSVLRAAGVLVMGDILRKLSMLLKPSRIRLFTDTRVLGLVSFALLAVLVTWSGVKAIQTNYDLQKQISKLTQENGVKKLENDNQALKNNYYKTDQFLELAARRQFSKAAPGETLVVVPKNIAQKYITNVTPVAQAPVAPTHKPGYQKNLEAWMDFFLHRQHSL